MVYSTHSTYEYIGLLTPLATTIVAGSQSALKHTMYPFIHHSTRPIATQGSRSAEQYILYLLHTFHLYQLKLSIFIFSYKGLFSNIHYKPLYSIT